MIQPTRLRFDRPTRTLTVETADGSLGAIPFELLRVASPSAEVRGHSAGPPATVPGKRDVGVERAEPVGNYAVRIVFDDGHDSGLFTWDYLAELAANADARLAEHSARLDAQGLSREA